MSGVAEKDVVDIVKTISKELGYPLNLSTIRPVGRPPGKEQVKDATLAFFVNGHVRRDDIVLLVSNPLFPDAVGEDVDKAEAVRNLLDSAAGSHVMRPKYVGRHETRSYAAFARLNTISGRKILRFPQKLFVAPKIVAWSAEMAQQTRTLPVSEAEFSRYFVQPLQFMLEDTHMSCDIRRFSEECLDVVNRAGRDLFTVAEHGDFWIGNVLFDRTIVPGAGAFLGDFFVIDWRGSRLDGYPCIDVIRFCRSIHAPGSACSDSLLRSYRTRLGLDAFEMGVYGMLGLGRLGMNLEYFPKERYLSLCRDIFRFLDAHGLTKAA